MQFDLDLTLQLDLDLTLQFQVDCSDEKAQMWLDLSDLRQGKLPFPFLLFKSSFMVVLILGGLHPVDRTGCPPNPSCQSKDNRCYFFYFFWVHICPSATQYGLF